MKAKLIKTSKDYYHLVIKKSNYYYGHTSPEFCELQNKDGSYTHKLSLKNCDEIFGVVDVEKLAEEYAGTAHDIIDEPYQNGLFYGFMAGSKKTMELNKDKVFTLEDIKRAIQFGKGMELWKEEEQINKFIQSIQQPTEIDVEIEMICPHPEDAYRCGLQYGCGDDGCYHPNKVPYLDSEGCLILKPIV